MSASWVIREKKSGKVLFETYNPRVLECLNTVKYEAVPIEEYLASLNRKIKASDDSKTTDYLYDFHSKG